MCVYRAEIVCIPGSYVASCYYVFVNIQQLYPWPCRMILLPSWNLCLLHGPMHATPVATIGVTPFVLGQQEFYYIPEIHYQ